MPGLAPNPNMPMDGIHLMLDRRAQEQEKLGRPCEPSPSSEEANPPYYFPELPAILPEHTKTTKVSPKGNKGKQGKEKPISDPQSVMECVMAIMGVNAGETNIPEGDRKLLSHNTESSFAMPQLTGMVLALHQVVTAQATLISDLVLKIDQTTVESQTVLSNVAKKMDNLNKNLDCLNQSMSSVKSQMG